MASNVDPAVPPEGNANTADVRANFQAIKTEIESLQDTIGAKAIVTGSRADGVALANLLLVLDNIGLIDDQSTN